jgi:hypothetical protein
MGELGSRLCVGQHSLFLLSPATVFVCGAARKAPPKAFARGQLMAELTSNPSN